MYLIGLKSVHDSFLGLTLNSDIYFLLCMKQCVREVDML